MDRFICLFPWFVMPFMLRPPWSGASLRHFTVLVLQVSHGYIEKENVRLPLVMIAHDNDDDDEEEEEEKDKEEDDEEGN